MGLGVRLTGSREERLLLLLLLLEEQLLESKLLEIQLGVHG